MQSSKESECDAHEKSSTSSVRSHNEAEKSEIDAFLVLDVEGTCEKDEGMHAPNEIIEWPVCLMRWKDDQRRSLELGGVFHSYVRPTLRPTLSNFCTELTGITQAQVDSAPLFPEVLEACAAFLAKHRLIDGQTGERLQPFCWCSDGPWDIRDFVVKQLFISKISMPKWLQGDVLNVRRIFSAWKYKHTNTVLNKKSPNIDTQLRELCLSPFEGRKHSGIDDARNIARILAELARRECHLVPNTMVDLKRRWPWMRRKGKIDLSRCSSG